MERFFSLGPSPHLYLGKTAQKITWVRLAALLPVWLAGFILFPLEGLRILVIGISCVVFLEWATAKAQRKPAQLSSGRLISSAVLFASLIPVHAPWWFVVAGSMLFFLFGEKMLGGPGENIFHPTLVAIAILGTAFPGRLFLSWSAGHVAGASPIAVIIGGGIAFFLKVIRWETPTAFLASLCVMFLASGNFLAMGSFSSALLFVAFFILTDHETSPVTSAARFLYGAIGGLLTCAMMDETYFLLRLSGALLMANASVPLLDYLCRPKGARQ